MDEAARAATVDDLGELSRLADMAIAELRPHRGGDVWYRTIGRADPVADSLRADLGSPDTLVVVGTIDEVIIGYGVVTAKPLRDGTTLAVVSDLYTEPEARGVGIGEHMMDALVAFARSRNCFGIETVALPGDRDTKNFFETFGLVARALQVHRRLDP